MKTLCIAGKNDVAVNVLKYARETYGDQIRIVAIPDRSDDGINKWQQSLKWYCDRNAVPLVTLKDIYDEKKLYFLSLEFDRIVRPEKFASNRLYNIHFSKLPAYKGMYTSVLPILHDEPEGGVTLHKIRRGIDTGEIIEQQVFPIDFDMTSLKLYERCISEGTKLVIKYLDDLLNDKVEYHPQLSEHSSYYSTDAIDYGNLQFETNRTAAQIHNQIRAFAFRPYQLLKYGDAALLSSKISQDVSEEKPGTILEEDDISMTMATIDYNLLIYKDTLNLLMQAITENNNVLAKRLCSSKTVINEKEEHGWSPLIVAVYNNNFEMVQYLIDNGADVSVTNNNGTTILMYAKDCYKNTGDRTIFDYLIKLGLDINKKDYYGLSLADYCEKENVMELL